MNVVDSSGWIEYFLNGPNAAFFATPLDALDELVVPAITVYEVYRFTLSVRDRDLADAHAARMVQGQVIPVDRDLAVQAATVAHHHKLAMADAIILATAQAYNATVWTQDADFENLPGV